MLLHKECEITKYRIKSVRLDSWDYTTPWWYYVTICTKERCKHFGEVMNDNISLSVLGEIADKYWNEIPTHYPNVELDYYSIMPNHIHGIIILDDNPKMNSLGNIIGSYKAAIKKWCNNNGFKDFSWQSRFYEHIIRNEKDLERIRTYIRNNPIKWELDEYYQV